MARTERRDTARRYLAAIAVVAALIGVMAASGSAATGETTRVSVSTSGVAGNGSSLEPSISANGRFVAFESSANNLVSGDTNGHEDVFVHDRTTVMTERVSLGSSDNQASFSSSDPSISDDGSIVAFESGAENLVADDINNRPDIFVRDMGDGNSPPTANPDTYSTPKGNALEVADGPDDVLANDTDPDNDSLTVADGDTTDTDGANEVDPVSPPTDGDLLLRPDGSFAYTPDPDFAGEDSFTYKATDGTDESEAATVTINVVADTTPPTVTNVSPTDGAADVPNDTVVTATFSESMDADSVRGAFTLAKAGGGDTTSATVEYNSDLDTATLTPDSPLEAGATYTATVSTGAKDSAGNALAADEAWTFTVAADIPPECAFEGTGEPDTIIVGTPGDDILGGTPGSDLICGLGGKDTLRARAGNDNLSGGEGNDRTEGEADDDTMFDDAGRNTMDGGEGSDRMFGGPGKDDMDGGDGTDEMSGAKGIDEMDGGEGDDLMFGGLDVGDTMRGGPGVDEMSGGAGGERMEGGDGADLMRGFSGPDRMFGGDDVDRLLGGDDNDAIEGGEDRDGISGGDGRDSLRGENGNGEMSGGAGIDRVLGQADDDEVDGQDGKPKDTVSGGPGTDQCTSDPGDRVVGCP